MRVEFILYVKEQQQCRDFYRVPLGVEPVLDVPGMTEFDPAGCKLGLMPEDGIARIITPALPHPATGSAIPRTELYLQVDDLDAALLRAGEALALCISPAINRGWGHRVAYFADPDGHVIALASNITP